MNLTDIKYRKANKIIARHYKIWRGDHQSYNDFKKPAFEAVLTETNYVISDLKETIKNIDSWAKPKKVSASLLNFPSSDYIRTLRPCFNYCSVELSVSIFMSACCRCCCWKQSNLETIWTNSKYLSNHIENSKWNLLNWWRYSQNGWCDCRCSIVRTTLGLYLLQEVWQLVK
jgi:hypothetical protein